MTVFAGARGAGMAIALAVGLASTGPAKADTITLTTPSIGAGYALAFGGLNHLDTGFPVTRDACRFQGNRCATAFQTNLPVGQFDSALGTLQQVDVRFTTRSSFSARIQNRPGFGNPPASGTWTVGFDGLLLSTIELAGVIANDPTLPTFAFAFPGDPVGLSGFDFAIKGFGTALSGSIFDTVGVSDTTNLINSNLLSRTVSSSFTDAATLAAFTGSGNLSFNVSEHSASRATSNSNSAYSISRVSVAGPAGSVPFISTFIHNFFPQIEVTYTFEAASSGTGGSGGGAMDIPEAPGMAVLAVGLGVLGWLRRRRRVA